MLTCWAAALFGPGVFPGSELTGVRCHEDFGSTSIVTLWSLILTGVNSSAGIFRYSATEATTLEYHTVAVTVTGPRCDLIGQRPGVALVDGLERLQPVVGTERRSVPLGDRHPPSGIEIGEAEDPVSGGHRRIAQEALEALDLLNVADVLVGEGVG